MKKLRMSKVCRTLGHDWPVIGSDIYGDPVAWFECRRCGKTHQQRKARLMSQMVKDLQKPSLWERIKFTARNFMSNLVSRLRRKR